LYLSPKYLPIQLSQEEDTQLEWVDIEVDDDSLGLFNSFNFFFIFFLRSLALISIFFD
jgi:hypothetical protein